MKKFLFGAAASVLALGACSSDDVLQSSINSDAISFAVTNSATSRAAQSYCNSNMPASFKVSAQIHGQSGFYFENDMATREGESTVYSTSTPRWWPEEGSLDFHAWVNDDGTYSFDQSSNKAQFVNFAPKAGVSEQLDLLYGVAMDQSKAAGNVKLNFRHALSQIVFSARTEATSYNVAVKGVKIGHLNNQGTFTFGGVSTTDNYVNHTDQPNGNEGVIKGGAGVWTLNGGLSTYATSFTKVTLTNDNVELTKVEHEGGPDGSLLLLPQHQDAWVPAAAAGNADAAGFKGAYFLLDVELTNDKGVNLYTGEMAVPVEINWEQGTRYRYTFVFTDGNGGFTPDPDDPKPVLGGIKYDVTTDDFVPVNGGEKKPGDDPRPDADKYAYTLNFDANGGVGSMDALEVSNATADSYSFTAPACTMTRDKYQFKGWNTKADGSGVAYKVGDAVPVSGVAGQNVKTVLYAQWEYLYETITVTFDTDGEGTVTALSKEVKKGSGEQVTFTLPGVNIDQDAKGYGFEGWSYTPAAKKPFNAGEEDLLPEDLVYPNEEITIDHSVTLHAVYFKATSVIGGGGDKPEIED